MSTEFRTDKSVTVSEPFDGRLERYGIKPAEQADDYDTCRGLTDGQNYLSTYADENGFLSFMSRCGHNDVEKILDAIATEFQTVIFSEHEPQYWGFESEEELIAHISAISQERAALTEKETVGDSQLCIAASKNTARGDLTD